MKIRTGFISNSSTSCFLISNMSDNYISYLGMFKEIVSFYKLDNIIHIPTDSEYHKFHKEYRRDECVLYNRGIEEQTTLVEGFENEEYDFRNLFTAIASAIHPDRLKRDGGLRTNNFLIKWQYYNG